MEGCFVKAKYRVEKSGETRACPLRSIRAGSMPTSAKVEIEGQTISIRIRIR